MGDPNNPPACRFLESGSHDDIERAQLLRDQRLPELPEFDPNKRTFVFLEVAVGNRVLGEPPLPMQGSACMLPCAPHQTRRSPACISETIQISPLHLSPVNNQ